MVILVLLVFAVVAFELLVWFGAADSTDGFDSIEWERRRTWRRGV
jgi:hypothetical protein